MHLYHIYMLLQYKNDPATNCETSKADSFTFEALPHYFTIVAVQR